MYSKKNQRVPKYVSRAQWKCILYTEKSKHVLKKKTDKNRQRIKRKPKKWTKKQRKVKYNKEKRKKCSENKENQI